MLAEPKPVDKIIIDDGKCSPAPTQISAEHLTVVRQAELLLETDQSRVAFEPGVSFVCGAAIFSGEAPINLLKGRRRAANQQLWPRSGLSSIDIGNCLLH